ncbi:hypothetical protein BDK51DRAFT_36805 [Blyttiomyces helicus]|uniref:Secreted protein n=1 Tax=Blyttiomyces helicus TaxID=388810 RepID=A0A4P9WQF8_9FUNG|nr:hypothetical protein BDK51DRAFT_36805 [Blyttiomyces helicus]|eukprot:RKO93106.1 hypothetical protein BDK51DRAFT_36805 [Blyttiomyces helicus]
MPFLVACCARAWLLPVAHVEDAPPPCSRRNEASTKTPSLFAQAAAVHLHHRICEGMEGVSTSGHMCWLRNRFPHWTSSLCPFEVPSHATVRCVSSLVVSGSEQRSATGSPAFSRG